MALTAAQVREHVGAMIQYGLNNAEYLLRGGLDFRDLVRWSKLYRVGGTLGTIADRTEAMRTFLKYVFMKTTGRDPVTDKHIFTKHWIDEVEPGESDVLES